MPETDRLTELEIRYTQLEELVTELSSVVYAQQRELEAAQALLRRLHTKLQGDPGLVEAGGDDPPPHY